MAIGGRDPGDEHVVGMVGEMISGEGVDEVVLAAEVRSGNGDQLTVAVVVATPPARATRSFPSGAKSAAATRIIGSLLVRDASTIAAIATASPTTS